MQAKAEFMNPGGSVKDRVAKQIIEDAEKMMKLGEGGTIVEGTSGSTGISLAIIAKAKGYNCLIYMPDDQAVEKSQLLAKIGATVERVPPVSISNPQHYCNIEQRVCQERDDYFYIEIA